MSQYIAGGLMLLLLIGTAVLGLEVYGIYQAAHMVEAALLDGQPKLAADGGVTPTVERLVRQRVAAEGGNPDRLEIKGSRPHTAYGELVTLRITYRYPFALPLLGSSAWEKGVYTVARTATTVSGWQP
ncbi:MAG TPA: hypothetical protein VNT75_17835 [Symbiobacteriaceae bacterium]|nr:hypothetical protein [Symbiobacteriaceae bacterium]